MLWINDGANCSVKNNSQSYKGSLLPQNKLLFRSGPTEQHWGIGHGYDGYN